jgi:hypothetical protein
LAESAVSVDGSQRGDAYGAPTEAMLSKRRLLASHASTDPVYGGKPLPDWRRFAPATIRQEATCYL